MLLAADRIHKGLFQVAATHALNTMHSFQAQSVSVQVLWSRYAFAAPAYPSTCSLSHSFRSSAHCCSNTCAYQSVKSCCTVTVQFDAPGGTVTPVELALQS